MADYSILFLHGDDLLSTIIEDAPSLPKALKEFKLYYTYDEIFAVSDLGVRVEGRSYEK